MKADGLIGKETWSRLNVTIDQLISQALINLDRTRWLPADLGANSIVVNLAAQELTYTVDRKVFMFFKTPTVVPKDRLLCWWTVFPVLF